MRYSTLLKFHSKTIFVLGLIIGLITPPDLVSSSQIQAETIRFAVIGDYGSSGKNESDVAQLVKSWKPDFIITVGDNNYPDGAESTIDQNIGQYFHEYIHPYAGSYGPGADVNRFFPSLGNHDWDTPNAQPYLDYFTLPGNERYYDFIQGPVHFFVLDSDPREPDGISSTSVQALWLKDALAVSTSPWKFVYLHHSPYSSGKHGSNADVQWPFAEWGADAVFSGHDHLYERIILEGIPYFVNGLGGGSLYSFDTPVAGSKRRFEGDYGAMLVEASESQVTFQFYTRSSLLVDTYILDTDSDPYLDRVEKGLIELMEMMRPAVRISKLDLLPPNTYIAINYIEKVDENTISFRFFSTEPGHFLCSVDGNAFMICTSPFVYKAQTIGPHLFEVRSVDEAGNIDVTPARHSWNSLDGSNIVDD